MLRFSASTVTSRSSTESNDDNCEVILTPWDAKDRLTPWKCPLYASPRGYVTSAITRYSAVISRTRGYLRRSPPLAAGCEPPIPRHARAFADVVTSGAAPWRSLGRTSSYDSSHRDAGSSRSELRQRSRVPSTQRYSLTPPCRGGSSLPQLATPQRQGQTRRKPGAQSHRAPPPPPSRSPNAPEDPR